MPDQKPLFIDYHCHLDLYPDYVAQFQRCATDRIATLTVTTTPRAWPRNKELASKSPMVRAGLGLHPQLVAEHKGELNTFEKYLPEARYVAEVGLDAGPAHYNSYGDQKRIFEAILKLCAGAGNRILSVHAVRSVPEVLKMVEAHLAGTDNRVVLHWFSGSVGDAKRAAALGCYFSVNHAMLAKPTGVALIRAIPSQRLLTETDGPFTKVGSRPSTPADVKRTVGSLGQVLGLGPEGAQELLLRNLAQLEGGDAMAEQPNRQPGGTHE
jgi:TatD DNase family protein